jgi:hypothetical protein
MGAPRFGLQDAGGVGGVPPAPSEAAADAEFRIIVRALEEALAVAGETLDEVGDTLDGLLADTRATNERLSAGEAVIEARHAAIAALIAERSRPQA